MRTAVLLAGLALASAPATPAATPTAPVPKAPDIRYVTAAQVEVRAGPSEKLYPTNVLHRGDRVEVLVESNGAWLAIRPPEGSFSWINTRFLRDIAPHQPNYVVVQDGMSVDVIIGSSLLRSRPNIAGTQLRRGAQVRSIGPTQTDAEGTWMPVEPPPGEMRYIPADAVTRPAGGEGPGGVVTAASAGGLPTPPLPTAPVPAPPQPPNPDTLWRQAQQAERSGQIAEAVRLYNQAGAANANVNPARSTEAFARASWLENANRYPGVPTSALIPARPVQSVVPASEVRYTTGSPDRVFPIPAQPMSTVRLAAPSGAGLPPCGPSGYPEAVAPAGTAGSPSGPGFLRRAGRTVESQRTYVLENSRGIPILYVTPQPGLDLEPYVARHVELFGSVSYHSEIRANCMVVTSVQPLP